MFRAIARLLLPLCTGFAAFPVQAQVQDGGRTALSGSLRLSYFSSSRDLDDVRHFPVATGEAEIRHTLSENQRLELKARVIVEDPGRAGHTNTQWIDAHWFARSERVDLRVGQQKIRWGKADGINPTDFFTPIDYTVPLPLEDDRYLSVPAIRTDVHMNDMDSVSLVVEPDFTPTSLPWPSVSPVTVQEDEPSGWQRGLRWLHTGERLDWSLSAFDGYSTLPLLHFDGLAADGSPRYIRHYAAIRGFGADVARNFGQVGFRAEIAYTAPSDSERQGVQPSYFLVTGIDHSFDDWNINLQALVHHTPHYRDTNAYSSPQEQWAATQNAIVHGQQDRFVYGMTARIVADWLNDTLQTELLAVSQFAPTNYLVRPLATYALTDRLKIRAGAEYYSGPDLSYFGLLKRNRTVFMELQLFY